MSEYEPFRAKIDQPSTLQPLHEYHGLVGIAVVDHKDSDIVTLYLTEGETRSMRIFKSSIRRI